MANEFDLVALAQLADDLLTRGAVHIGLLLAPHRELDVGGLRRADQFIAICLSNIVDRLITPEPVPEPIEEGDRQPRQRQKNNDESRHRPLIHQRPRHAKPPL